MLFGYFVPFHGKVLYILLSFSVDGNVRVLHCEFYDNCSVNYIMINRHNTVYFFNTHCSIATEAYFDRVIRNNPDI